MTGTLTSDTFSSFSGFSLASTAPTGNLAATGNPLPVELTRFTTTRQAVGVALSWATASEKNSAWFNVERSPDGQDFACASRVAAHGGSNAAGQLCRPRPRRAGHFYYHLRQVDADGTTACSPVMSVAGHAESSAVFPNPATETVSFQLPAAAPYRVLNVLGQVLHGTAEAGLTTLPVATLPAGTYLLELQSSTGRNVQRFVKQ